MLVLGLGAKWTRFGQVQTSLEARTGQAQSDPSDLSISCAHEELSTDDSDSTSGMEVMLVVQPIQAVVLNPHISMAWPSLKEGSFVARARCEQCSV